MLEKVEVDQEIDAECQSTKFQNYYEVLQVEDDYFPDNETVTKSKGLTKKAKANMKKILDEAFAEGLRLEVICYFMDLEELVEEVFNIHHQVKKQRRTMMEATVVSTLAFKTAVNLTANLQLRDIIAEAAFVEYNGRFTSRDCNEWFKLTFATNFLTRTNPLIAGSQMISNHLQYITVANGLSRQCAVRSAISTMHSREWIP
ncbi:unnamed protein product [Phytophthora lilii]|uniref:Unnamed protein product n=1 Tax=Phytophthora lilii TaxID=2077276 RepID=A0A9W6WYH7_9STRA|nr:unnamed protein product [Phytophthora lilii]